LRQAGILAGVGLIFAYFAYLLVLIPKVGWVLSLVGVILFLVGVYRISRIANDKRIFRYFLLHLMLSFVALVVAFLAVVAFLIVVSLILLILSLVPSVKAYRLLAEVTGVGLFNTVATLYKWGAILVTGVGLFDTVATLYKWRAILLIVFGIGVILMIVGSIIAVVGFFSIKEKTSSA